MAMLDASYRSTTIRTDRPEPDEPYFEDALAGDPPMTVLKRTANLALAPFAILALGLALLLAILWRTA